MAPHSSTEGATYHPFLPFPPLGDEAIKEVGLSSHDRPSPGSDQSIYAALELFVDARVDLGA